MAFYKTNGDFINAVQVGAQPDMLTFTHDGDYLLTANEGEPSGYGEGQVDPEGSVSIIPFKQGFGNVKKLRDRDVRTASFSKYIGKEAELRAQGIRIYGPGATPRRTSSPSTSRSRRTRARPSSRCRKTTRLPRSTSGRRA